MSNAAVVPAPSASSSEAEGLPIEPVLTTHRLFEAFDEQKKGLEILHGDLFDSRATIALSALSAVGAIGDARSFPLVARLLAGTSEEILCAAVKALGTIPHPGVLKLLLELAKTTRSDRLRREVLAALCAAAPREREVVSLIRQAARSPMGSAGARAHAAGLLLKVGGPLALEELLVDAREEVLDQILTSATGDSGLAPRTVTHCATLYARLPARNRAALIVLATRQDLPESIGLVRLALSDPHAEVRRAGYAALGVEPHQIPWYSDIVLHLASAVETNPSIEDEVQQTIARIRKTPEVGASITASTRGAVMSRVADLYKQLGLEGRKVSSDTHELGWLITRSKEYVEYYCDDEFKAGLLRWLKGASSDTTEGLLKMLKATAVRVEVRHFDGYSAVADLIKNPKRTGIALVARELALAHTGKSRILWQLIRVLRLSEIFLTPTQNAADAPLLKTMFTWARQEKLFRLAEAALAALSRVDPASAEVGCKECVALPLASKVLAIASLHLLRDLRPDQLEPSATRLLASQDDPYVTMNSLEVISDGPSSTSGELAKALLTRLSLASSREVRDAIVAYLGDKMSLDITESLKDRGVGGDEAVREAALAILDRRIDAKLIANRDGTIEFLYRVLRGDHQPSRRSAAVMLWKLGDEYALEVLRDFLSTDGDDTAVDILRRLQSVIRPSLLDVFSQLLPREGAPLQGALRACILPLDRGPLRSGILEAALRLRRGATPDDEADDVLGVEPVAPDVELRSERTTFQFERENMQELVMFFSDIKGYSKKASILPPMQLNALIQDYEKILLAHIESHGGELVKRMGDGHMIVFQQPLPAVLAAIRLQKTLRRFNRYRDENTQVVIRIGIHSGSVVRKAQGDVLGNAVNIASRLESSARPGSILISDVVQEKVKDAIHAREIGHISVKNIPDPIRVFEPYEIVLDLPAELDPLKNAKTAASEQTAAAATNVSLERETYMEIARCFSALVALCKKAEGGTVSLAALNEQVLARWGRLRPRLPGFAPAQKK